MGEWAVVDEVDFHIGAKDAMRHVFDILTNERQEVLVELVGDIGTPASVNDGRRP